MCDKFGLATNPEDTVWADVVTTSTGRIIAGSLSPTVEVDLIICGSRSKDERWDPWVENSFSLARGLS